MLTAAQNPFIIISVTIINYKGVLCMAATKYSRQRESILECLRGRCDHPTADMVYMSVREEFPKISLGTVYRNLALLVQQGEILHLFCGEGLERYDGCTKPHYHFRCKECGHVLDLTLAPMEHIDVLAGNGFDGEIQGHYTFFYGICGECKKVKKSS